MEDSHRNTEVERYDPADEQARETWQGHPIPQVPDLDRMPVVARPFRIVNLQHWIDLNA
jgi:hypothetical protein